MIDTDKIVIVGGGSSGWMSAAALIRAFPEKDITVIESPNFKTIGVGESTLGQIGLWIKWLGIKDEDFMPKTDATYKLSIKLQDFYKEDSGYFHYPFGSPLYEASNYGWIDWQVKKILYPDISLNDYAETMFPVVTLAEQNKISLNENGNLDNFNFYNNHAYHFDAIKFGEYLKNDYCIPRGVKIIKDTVIKVNISEKGVDSLILSDNSKISSDLFIDCTGFKSLLLGSALGEPFEDFSQILPNNSAWTTRIPYTDKNIELQPFTTCTAIENGWVWNVPTWSRIGSGYVFSDKYADDSQALQEFKKYLKSDKMKYFNPKRDVESFDYNLLKFKVGIYNRTFVKNVVAIGLSAGFAEPLESNGLFTTHEFLDKLIKTLKRGKVTQWDRNAYNVATRSQFSLFAEFISIHYALSNRNSTEYWKDISEKNFVSILEDDKNQEWGFRSLIDINLKGKYVDVNNLSYTGLLCIASGMNYFPVSDQLLDIYSMIEGKGFLEKANDLFSFWEKRKQKWKIETRQSPNMYKFLKQNIYNNMR